MVNDDISERREPKLEELLREVLDVGVVELDDGLGVGTSPEQLIAEIFDEIGIER